MELRTVSNRKLKFEVTVWFFRFPTPPKRVDERKLSFSPVLGLRVLSRSSTDVVKRHVDSTQRNPPSRKSLDDNCLLISI